MKQIMKANEIGIPDGVEPLAYADSGHLTALIWKSKKGCRFVVFRWDQQTSEVSTELQPEDVEHLAYLTAFIANAVHSFGICNDRLNDDLGCLGHCLNQTLGLTFDEPSGFLRRKPVQ